MIEAETRAYTTLLASPEAREAFTAFLEKRPPRFDDPRRPHRPGDGFGMPRPAPRPQYEPGTEPVPVLVRPPSAR